MRGLIVKQPFASIIVKGEKKWEIRKTNTNIRGEILIVSDGYALGKVKLVDILGPFTVKELLKHYSYHKADEKFLKEYSKGKKLYAWVFEDPEEFKEKIRIKIPKGAKIWVKL